MYTVNFLGLNYFNACKAGERDALIPNGTPAAGKDGGLPPHFASFFIEADRYDSDNWWPEQVYPLPISLEIRIGEFRTVNVIEFRIPPKPEPETPPVELRFSCNKGTLRNLNLEDALPKLQNYGFVLDSRPDAIVNVPFPSGDLEVFRFGASTVVRWLIQDHDDPITITASDGEKPRWVKLKKSDGLLPAEIVFSNTVELIPHTKSSGNGQPRDRGHEMTGDCMASAHDKPAEPAEPAGMHAGHDEMATRANDGAPVQGGMHNHSGAAGHFVLFAKLDKNRSVEKLEAATAAGFPDSATLRPAAFAHPYLAYLSSMRETPGEQCSGSCC